MTIDNYKEIIESESSVDTSKKRRSKHVTGRGLIAVTVASGLALGLSACSEAAPEPLEKEYSVGDVMLPAELALSRQNVRELCNTGEGAAELRQEWKDYGYEEKSGMPFIEAFTYMSDLKYTTDLNDIINFGAYTYPTVESLSSDCLDATFLVSQNIHEITYPETAAPLLDGFHLNDGSDPVIPLERIFNTIKANG